MKQLVPRNEIELFRKKIDISKIEDSLLSITLSSYSDYKLHNIFEKLVKDEYNIDCFRDCKIISLKNYFNSYGIPFTTFTFSFTDCEQYGVCKEDAVYLKAKPVTLSPTENNYSIFNKLKKWLFINI